jgi:hypothetical protein
MDEDNLILPRDDDVGDDDAAPLPAPMLLPMWAPPRLARGREEDALDLLQALRRQRTDGPAAPAAPAPARAVPAPDAEPPDLIALATQQALHGMAGVFSTFWQFEEHVTIAMVGLVAGTDHPRAPAALLGSWVVRSSVALADKELGAVSGLVLILSQVVLARTTPADIFHARKQHRSYDARTSAGALARGGGKDARARKTDKDKTRVRGQARPC